MDFWRQTETPATDDNRRRHGRLKTEGTLSSLGEVVDISASGMRVIRKGSMPVTEGEAFRIELQIDKQVLPVDVAVRRIRKIGRRKTEFGVEFINLSEEDRMNITRLARIAAQGARALW